MGSATGNGLWIVLAFCCLFLGCQTGQEMASSASQDGGSMPVKKSAVAAELGQVEVHVGEFQHFSKPNLKAKQII